MNIIKNKLQICITIVFIAFLIWWISFQHVVTSQGLSVQWFGGTYGVIALFASIVGLIASFKWGGYKTVLGRALMFLSFALFAQEVGQIVETYYIYGAKIQIPYPSWADAAYFASTLLYLCGAFTLTKVTGASVILKNRNYKVLAALVIIALLAVSSFIFLFHHQFDTHKPLTVFLDIGYPIGDALYIAFGLVGFLISAKFLGGLLKPGIFILIFGLVMQYVSDFTFLYQSDRGTYLSGKYDDLSYFVTYYIMAIAMISFLSTYQKLKASTSKNSYHGSKQDAEG